VIKTKSSATKWKDTWLPHNLTCN